MTEKNPSHFWVVDLSTTTPKVWLDRGSSLCTDEGLSLKLCNLQGLWADFIPRGARSPLSTFCWLLPPLSLTLSHRIELFLQATWLNAACPFVFIQTDCFVTNAAYRDQSVRSLVSGFGFDFLRLCLMEGPNVFTCLQPWSRSQRAHFSQAHTEFHFIATWDTRNLAAHAH